MEHLGFVINTQTWTISLSEKKLLKIVQLATDIIQEGGYTLQTLAKFLGVAESVNVHMHCIQLFPSSVDGFIIYMSYEQQRALRRPHIKRPDSSNTIVTW